MTTSPFEVGQNGSWDSLPDAEPVVKLEAAPEQKPDLGEVPTPGICPVCNEAIIREPGSRGRLPKYHPGCKPAGRSGVTTAGRRGGSAKAEAEADACIASLQQLVTKTAVMLSVVDRFDAFAVMVALPNVCENLKGVLVRYDGLRKEMLAMQTGGSIIGLVLALIMLALPVAAHHGLLGRTKVAQLLVEMPFTMLKIQQRLKEGSEALTAMMQEQLLKAAEENKRHREDAERVRTAASNGAS